MTEKLLRKQLKAYFGNRVLWIEPAPGSTNGLPDCLLAFHGHLVPCELKSDGGKMRPSQKRVNRMLYENGINAVVLEHKGGQSFWCHFFGGIDVGRQYASFNGMRAFDGTMKEILK
jgi:hypothetical protein